MIKDEVDKNLQESWERSDCVRKLQEIVQEIEDSVPGSRTKGMMYELVDLVLIMGERVHDLEMRVINYEVRGDLEERTEKVRVDGKKQQASDLYRQKRDWRIR